MSESLHINSECDCPKVECSRHGNCVECVKRHNGLESLPHCTFPQPVRTYEVFYKYLKEKFEA